MSGDWLAFDGRIEPILRGGKVYTVLVLPAEVAAALGAVRRVEGEIDEHPVNLAVTTAPEVSGPFVWAGASLLARIGAHPGDHVAVRLRPAPDAAVDLPDDVAQALRAGGVTAAWAALTPGRRRGLLYGIERARSAGTRAKRIAALVADLAPGAD